MATVQNKLAPAEPVVVERVPTDHGNLHRSRDEFVAKLRKDKEIKAKLDLEKARLEKEAAKEMAALEKAGAEDSNPKAKDKKIQAEE